MIELYRYRNFGTSQMDDKKGLRSEFCSGKDKMARRMVRLRSFLRHTSTTSLHNGLQGDQQDPELHPHNY